MCTQTRRASRLRTSVLGLALGSLASLVGSADLLLLVGLAGPAAAVLVPSVAAAEAETAQSLIEAGQRKFAAGDFAGAVAAFSRAQVLSPRDATPLFLRGSAQQRLGKLAEAEADLRAALRLDPKLPNAFEIKAELAAILTDSKRPKDAAELLEQLVRDRPDHFDSLYNLGLAREALQDFAAAAAVYARAVSKKPTEIDARVRLIESLRKAGRYAEALTAGKEALTLAQRLSAPANVQAGILDELGLAQRRLGDLKTAEASFRSALAQAPTLHGIRLHLATTLAAAGRCPDALREAASLPSAAPFAAPVAKLRTDCAAKK